MRIDFEKLEKFATGRHEYKGAPMVYRGRRLSPKRRRQWRDVYESARRRGFNKEDAAQQAWAAVKRALGAR